MIVVTGAAGFIGSNLVKALNQHGRSDVLAVDDLTDGRKMFNLADCEIIDYVDKEQFINAISGGEFDGKFSVVFHQGACSTTTEWANSNHLPSSSHYFWCSNNRI